MHRFIRCQNYMMFPLVLYPHPTPNFEDVYCLLCGRRRVDVARYQMICLVLRIWQNTDIFLPVPSLCFVCEVCCRWPDSLNTWSQFIADCFSVYAAKNQKLVMFNQILLSIKFQPLGRRYARLGDFSLYQRSQRVTSDPETDPLVLQQ